MEKLSISEKLVSAVGDIYVISSDKGVKEVLVNSKHSKVYEKGDPHYAIKQIKDYFDGALKYFDLPLDITVSEFTQMVLRETTNIQYGKTASYGDIAKAIRNPKASRAVGGALNRNPIPIIIPCHRVVAKHSLGGFAMGADTKVKLLMLEGADIDLDARL